MRAELDVLLAEVSASAQISMELETAGNRVVLATNEPGVLDWPRRYLVPTYAIREPASVERPIVEVVRSAELHSRAREMFEPDGRGEPSVTYEDNRVQRYRIGDDLVALAYEWRPGVTFVEREREIVRFVTADGPGEEAFEAVPFEAARLVREVLTKALEEQGRFVLHAGAVSVGGRGCVLCGPKFAGKTTLACALMEHLGADFVANDRIYVGPVGGEVAVLAWPMSIRIGVGTCLGSARLRRLLEAGGELAYPQTGWDPAAGIAPEEAEELARSPQGLKVELIPTELERALETRAVPGAPLGAIVLPRRDPEGPAAEVRLVADDEAAAALSAELLTPADDAYPDWLGLRRRSAADLVADGERLVAEMVRAVPALEVRFSDAGAAAKAVGDTLQASWPHPPNGGRTASTRAPGVV